MSASGGKSYDQGPQIGGGPAPIQQPQQPNIYARYGGQQNVDSDPYTEGYQPPDSMPKTPVQQPPQPGIGQPGMPGGKSGPGMPGGKGGFGPTIGTHQLSPNQPSPLGPEGQQPVTPQQPMGAPSTPGGKSADQQDRLDFARWNAGRPQTMEYLTPEAAKAKSDRQYAQWVEQGKPQASGGKSGFESPMISNHAAINVPFDPTVSNQI